MGSCTGLLASWLTGSSNRLVNYGGFVLVSIVTDIPLHIPDIHDGSDHASDRQFVRGVDSRSVVIWSRPGGEDGLCNLHVVPPGNLAFYARANAETHLFYSVDQL